MSLYANHFIRMCCGECGIEFEVPPHFYTERQQTGKNWYCPNGHSRVFRESEADKMRRERDIARQQLARAEQEKNEAEAKQRLAERKLAKIKRRASVGSCPCYQRTFSNMARHMKTKHPEFIAEAAENVVRLKA